VHATRIANDLDACWKASPRQISKTNDSATVPVRLVASRDVYVFRRALVFGKKTARTVNVGSVWLGTSSVNDAQPWEIRTDEVHLWDAPPGAKIDPYDYYLDVANANDGVQILVLA